MVMKKRTVLHWTTAGAWDSESSTIKSPRKQILALHLMVSRMKSPILGRCCHCHCCCVVRFGAMIGKVFVTQTQVRGTWWDSNKLAWVDDTNTFLHIMTNRCSSSGDRGAICLQTSTSLFWSAIALLLRHAEVSWANGLFLTMRSGLNVASVNMGRQWQHSFGSSDPMSLKVSTNVVRKLAPWRCDVPHGATLEARSIGGHICDVD